MRGDHVAAQFMCGEAALAMWLSGPEGGDERVRVKVNCAFWRSFFMLLFLFCGHVLPRLA